MQLSLGLAAGPPFPRREFLSGLSSGGQWGGDGGNGWRAEGGEEGGREGGEEGGRRISIHNCVPKVMRLTLTSSNTNGIEAVGSLFWSDCRSTLNGTPRRAFSAANIHTQNAGITLFLFLSCNLQQQVLADHRLGPTLAHCNGGGGLGLSNRPLFIHHKICRFSKHVEKGCFSVRIRSVPL